MNYLVDEACASSKGANTVMSYLHHYFDTHGLGEKKLILHADNCWLVDIMIIIQCNLRLYFLLMSIAMKAHLWNSAVLFSNGLFE